MATWDSDIPLKGYVGFAEYAKKGCNFKDIQVTELEL